MTNYRLLTILIIGVSLTKVQAQYRTKMRNISHYEVGIGGGSAIYVGDLAPASQLLQSIYPLPRWNAGVNLTYHLNPHISARASFTWIRLVGDDYTYNKEDPNLHPIQFQRNLHFRNDLKEIALSGIYQLNPETRRPYQRPGLTPYFMLGIALVAHNPKARLPTSVSSGKSTAWTDLQPLGTEGQGQPGYANPYSLITMAIPVGVGLRWRLAERLNLSAELSFRYTFTDYIDDVGGLYPNKDNLSSQESIMFSDRRLEPVSARTQEDRSNDLARLVSVPANVRRGASGNDYYVMTQVAIHYLIIPSPKCPPGR